jgi:hypothetical protein
MINNGKDFLTSAFKSMASVREEQATRIAARASFCIERNSNGETANNVKSI